jgi:spore coat polysaccharide biosynthesis protein SpsF (cytidylyltransferase family)
MINTQIREYHESNVVRIGRDCPDFDNLSLSREIIEATNESGTNYVVIDLIDVVDWVKKNRPEMLGR